MLEWLVPSILTAGGVLSTNASARRQSEKQMAFQKMMSDTAVQRGQADIKAAGLNPALAYGYQAGSASGSQAQVGDVLGAGVSSALSARANAAQVDILQKQAAKAAADAATAMYGAREAEIKARPWMDADSNGINELWQEYTRKRIQADIDTAPLAVQALRSELIGQNSVNAINAARLGPAQLRKRVADFGNFTAEGLSNLFHSSKAAAEAWMLAKPVPPITYKK